MVSGTSAALSAERLTHRFGERLALDDLSFDVAPSELVAVIGPNGAGKTTLLSILAGVLTPTSGTVHLDRRGRDEHEPIGRSVGWVPQQPALYSKLTVAENLMLFARLERVADPEATVERMLEQTGLRERAHNQVKELSGGNQQRVNIALGLLAEPLVLLLDEPSSALDPRQRARLWEFIANLSDHGTSVVYSTHDVLEAQHHADRVLALDEGRLVFVGAPAEMDWSY
ncbi:MAG: heme ABC exporter ATP-binding protein CcmA [Conexibacteraceae bacterium]|nr:heme ABC exporter ATP-binding protein CcmA [Conexibacteraceae bacterium]